MKNNICELAVHRILTRWYTESPVKKIFGSNLPDISLCHQCDDVCDSNQLLPTLKSIQINTPEYRDALEHLNSFLPRIRGFHAKPFDYAFMHSEYPDFAEDLINAFQRVFKIEATYGIVRVPYRQELYDFCYVQSKYPNHPPVLYAPDMYQCLCPCCDFQKDYFWRIGWEYVYCFCTEYSPLHTLELVCDGDMTEKYHSIQNTGTQLFHVFNAYLEEEFLANEENEEYRHRKDVEGGTI